MTRSSATSTTRYLFWIGLSGALYGTLGVFGTHLIQQGFSIPAMLFWRFFVAALSVLVVSRGEFRRTRGQSKESKQGLLSIVVNAVLYAMSSIFYFISSQYVGTGMGMVIFYTYPLFIYLWLWLFWKEKISSRSWASLVLALGGILFLNRGNSSAAHLIGIVAALLAPASYAAYILVSKRQMNKVNPLLSTLVLCTANAAYFLVAALAEGAFSWPHSLGCVIEILGLGVLATAAPILLMLIGLKRVGADQAAILSVLEPAVTVVLGVLFLGESFSSWQVVGVVVVLVATVVSVLPDSTFRS